MSGAVIGLLRLQDTYRLFTKDLADGVIRGRNISSPLSGFFTFLENFILTIQFNFLNFSA